MASIRIPRCKYKAYTILCQCDLFEKLRRPYTKMTVTSCYLLCHGLHKCKCNVRSAICCVVSWSSDYSMDNRLKAQRLVIEVRASDN